MRNSKVASTNTKVLKSPWRSDEKYATLATCDQTFVAYATSRATFWKAQFDIEYLEKCLELVLEDLPFLGGRLSPVKLPFGWTMEDLRVANTNEGLEFSVISAPTLTLLDCGPDTWPMKNVTISDPQVPFWIPTMDTGKKLLKGKEALCKVQLTQLSDGSILALTASHTITDGMHWPALMTHIAARYRQVASGGHAQPQDLILTNASSRCSLSLDHMTKAVLRGGEAEWQPEPFHVKPSFGDYFRAAGLLWSNASAKIQLDILFLPRDLLTNLKRVVLEGITDGTPVTTGDVVQALAAMAVHAGEGKPLLPLLPKVMVSLVQIPGVDKGHFGNAVHPLAVGLRPPKTTTDYKGEGNSDLGASPLLPGNDDFLGCLRALARQIRVATAELRSTPTKALQAMYESAQVCSAPVHKSLAYLAGQRLPFVTATTNYIGTMLSDSTLDFGLGVKQEGYRSLTYPLARSMAVVRPAMAPYREGLFMSLSMTTAQAKRLRSHALLPTLAPDAVFLGSSRPARSCG